ncbi:MAG: choice-of-anchor Q domain-containing protein [Bacteroidota bacterium]
MKCRITALLLKRFLIILFLLVSVASNAQTVWYVSTTGNDDNNGTSWIAAFRTVQKALQVAAVGQSLWVAKGTYYPDEGGGMVKNDRTASFSLLKDISVYGGFEGTETFLYQRKWKINLTIFDGDLSKNDLSNFQNYGDNAYHVVKVVGPGITKSCVLDGLIIRGGNAFVSAGGNEPDNFGGGMYVLDAPPFLENCTFIKNRAYYGGGVYSGSSSNTGYDASFLNCVFEENLAISNGGGTYSSNTATSFFNSKFIRNRAIYGGGLALTEDRNIPVSTISVASIVNCLFYSNNANAGGGIFYTGASLYLFNSTFNNNTVTDKGGAVYVSGDAEISNSIFWGNAAGQEGPEIYYYIIDGVFNVTYSIIQTGFYGIGNLKKDPLFVNAATGDLRLSPASPAIDAGNDEWLENGVVYPFDLDLKPRKVRTIDMGAYELQVPPCPIIPALATNPSNSDCAGANVTITASGLAGMGATYGITFKYFSAETSDPYTGGTVIKTVANGSLSNEGSVASTSTSLLPSGKSYIYAILSTAPGNVACRPRQVTAINVNAARPILFVKAGATGANTGASWEDAFTKLQDALEKARSCGSVQQIWVAGGVYYPDEGATSVNNDRAAYFSARSVLNIYGGFAGNETDISQRNLNSENRSILSGEIQQDNLNTNNSYNLFVSNQKDSLLLLDGFTIRDGNAGNIASAQQSRGAGIYIQNPVGVFIMNCIFRNNIAITAPAIYVNGSGTIQFINCVAAGNTCTVGNGIIWNDNAAPAYFYCSVANNITIGSEKLVVKNTGTSTPTITNSIIWGNTPSIGGGTPTITYSIVQNSTVWPGTGNCNANPQFVSETVSDLRLLPCSPGINTGTTIFFISKDLVGASRIFGSQPDIGAYEFQQLSLLPVNGILYVNASATGNGTGNNWANAVRSLQHALRFSCSNVTQIWVAKGAYLPATNTNRDSAFTMRNNMEIYGGFAGTETQLSQRNWRLNPTILSGDIGISGNRSDNAHNVISNNNNNLDATALLDGFTITSGQANKAEYARARGGAMFNLNSSPLVRNCIFTSNFAAAYGGAVFNQGAAAMPTFINCVFSGNQAQFGGGVYNESAQTRIINSTFSSNQVTGNGGAMYSYGTPLVTITNSIVWGNSNTGVFTAVIDNSTPIAVSYSLIQGGYTGTGNINANPQFNSLAPIGLGQLGDFRLLDCSTAKNVGSNAALPVSITKDLAGLNRIAFTTVDMGAYEKQSAGGLFVYLDFIATGSNDGTSWANAFTSLEAALNDINQCSSGLALTLQIAAGNYLFPAGNPILINNLNGVVLGGYPNGGGTRNPTANPTILTGNVQALKSVQIDGVRILKP